uniref:Pectinesterase inhibitor domain-containing protein n=1 Tax=Hordeum vulgare subsp. vulgare TaxID=112509 RepID=A0A8I6XVX4_HORVV
MVALLANSTLIAIILMVFVPSSLAGINFISFVCKGISDHPECMDVLRSDPRSMNATTRVELQSISLDICTAAAREGEKTGKEEQAKNEQKRDEKLGFVLDMCINRYNDAVRTLEHARTDFGNHAYDEAARKIGEAHVAADYCEKWFYDQGAINVMKQMNKKMDDRCGICWQLIF